MKRVYWMIPSLVLAFSMLITPVIHQVSAAEITEQDTSVQEGIDKVVAEIDTLQKAIQGNGELIKVNEAGKKIDEAWDLIEEQVEEKNPEAYKNIEESLYPLIGEAQKPSPDMKKIQKLIPETTEKLKDYQASLQQ
ncbi:hypothetical protein [Pontibacillus salipaludis]|uniref:Uncharacterized protein n=1 Tax=Pontibacillus salipaludis TaxID=1697394 RepID=A0ABQ1PXG6_9BACI|nr:hypothetical protein [Pontibacillus salipaludis]GGD06152.1 hypothetical protein GCM10011389_12100 [Pontibacillus salipaludis]